MVTNILNCYHCIQQAMCTTTAQKTNKKQPFTDIVFMFYSFYIKTRKTNFSSGNFLFHKGLHVQQAHSEAVEDKCKLMRYIKEHEDFGPSLGT